MLLSSTIQPSHMFVDHSIELIVFGILLLVIIEILLRVEVEIFYCV